MRTLTAVVCGWLLVGVAACAERSSDGEILMPAPEATSAAADVPRACLPPAEARRGTTTGAPRWARFCPGPRGLTAPAEIPSDALITRLDLLAGLTEAAPAVASDAGCRSGFGRTYRVQIGYADGDVAEISGLAAPDCPGKVAGTGAWVRGSERLGVYGTLLAAFGQQYADAYEPSPADAPLVCPDDPRKPDSVDIDGPSASLDTGWHLGERVPMVMPLAAVRGIVCTWPHGDDAPTPEKLTTEEAERVRVGLHAIDNGMVDCAGSPDPTYTAVVEDRSGTRRAVTVIDSECSTVVRSDGGYGLGFPWLDR